MSITFFPDVAHPLANIAPSLNVANGNAHVPCMLMGVRYEDYRVPRHMLGAALDSVQSQSPADYLKPTTTSGGPSTGRIGVIDCGRSWDQVERYRTELISLIAFCQEHECELLWG
jgi:hypothetical protein